MFNPTVSPHDPNTVLVSCDMTGAYITKNAGKSWRMFNLRGRVHFFVFDPVDSRIIYAQATGLWRSTDGGDTWHLVYPEPASIRGIQMASDHADETIVAEPDPLGPIAALAVDPSESRVLYAAAGKPGHPSLFVSQNSGGNWKLLRTLPEMPLRLWILPHSTASSPVTLYVAAPHSVSVISGQNIETHPAPGSKPLTDVSFGLTNGLPAFFAVSGGSAYASADGGKTWNACILPGTGAKATAIAASLLHGRTAYLSYSDLHFGGKAWMGVAKTEDAGQSWNLLWKQADAPIPGVKDAWITPTFGPGWGENPLMLGVADQNPKLCYATDLGRTLRTDDGGATWNAVYSRKTANAGWQTTGLDVTTSYGFHFDPFDIKRQFITYTDIGLFRSEDGGHTWNSSIQGIPRDWWNTTYWVEFDPQVRNRMWSANSYTHDLPRPKMWRHNSPAEFLGGICRSDDGGRTWTKSSNGLPETAVTHLLLDPTSPPSRRTLYATAFGRGVYKSVDDGRTWTLKNKGIKQKDPFAWRLARSSNGALYLVVARRSDNGSIGNAEDGALYLSTDGAETWQAVSLPSGANGPNGITTDPRSPDRLYLAAWARAVGMHGEGGGIYCSNDRGRTWRNLLKRDQHVYDVVLDPKNPAVVYAAGFESSAWRSTDRGEHWNRIPGFNFKWAHRVIPDPADASSIYVTTFGGSVWHGPVAGSTNPSDIATPELQP